MPQEHRRPFQQKNRRRDDVLLPRMEAAVPQSSELFVQAWLSSWDEPRAGIAKLRSDVWAMPLRTDIVHRVVGLHSPHRLGQRTVNLKGLPFLHVALLPDARGAADATK